MLARILADLHHLGFSNFKGKNATNPFTARMHVQHHLRGPVMTHGEKGFENFDDKIHWSVVIVQQNDTIHGRQHDLGSSFFQHDAMFFVGFKFLTHGLILT